jgi:hypothetical protein
MTKPEKAFPAVAMGTYVTLVEKIPPSITGNFPSFSDLQVLSELMGIITVVQCG